MMVVFRLWTYSPTRCCVSSTYLAKGEYPIFCTALIKHET